MHRLTAGFVLGYHGCERTVAESLLSGESFKKSQNDDDWLGEGIYFWESNARRALSWAAARLRFRRSSAKPSAIGAVIDLRLCLDLTTSAGITQLRPAHLALSAAFEEAGRPMPQNQDGLFRRNLDCAVMNMVHQIRKGDNLPEIDTVRAAFIAGNTPYPGAGFRDQTHIQLCVRNPEYIRGMFRIPAADLR